MKVIILSDSHGNLGVLKRILLAEAPFDLLIHLGDGASDPMKLRSLTDFRFDAVCGNNDPPGEFPETLSLRVNGRICFFSHGHRFRVERGPEQLVRAARLAGAGWVFYGHTHRPLLERVGKVSLFNPGSVCSYLTRDPVYLCWEGEGAPVFRPIRGSLMAER